MEETNVTDEPGAYPKEELNCYTVQNIHVADLVVNIDSCETVMEEIKYEVGDTVDID